MIRAEYLQQILNLQQSLFKYFIREAQVLDRVHRMNRGGVIPAAEYLAAFKKRRGRMLLYKVHCYLPGLDQVPFSALGWQLACVYLKEVADNRYDTVNAFRSKELNPWFEAGECYVIG
jgi:hypothetical protein